MPAPAHVRDLGPDAGLPAGFRAAGVACGIKPAATPTSGCWCATPSSPVSAARFTDTGTAAAPVLLSRERCRLSALRAVLANSGCANAATGRRGLDDAAKTQGAAALAVGVERGEVALASTGGISHHLPVDAMLQGILDASSRLRREGDADFQQAIQTTDAFEKRASLEVELPSGTVRLSAQCKGAGMISPRFATMLCFVQTDAALAPETAELLLGVCVQALLRPLLGRRAALHQRHGDPDVLGRERRAGRARERGRAALRRGARRAAAPAGDPDGRRRRGRARIARVVVRGGDQEGVEAAARAVANSPLVKAALHGADPNWGRIVQAVGAALPGTAAPLAVDICDRGHCRCARRAPPSPTTRPRSPRR